jgi:hypothetical protein
VTPKIYRLGLALPGNAAATAIKSFFASLFQKKQRLAALPGDLGSYFNQYN